MAAQITGAEASRLPCMRIITPVITLPAAGLLLLQMRRPSKVTAQG